MFFFQYHLKEVFIFIFILPITSEEKIPSDNAEKGWVALNLFHFFGVKHFSIWVFNIKHEQEEKIEADLHFYFGSLTSDLQ